MRTADFLCLFEHRLYLYKHKLINLIYECSNKKILAFHACQDSSLYIVSNLLLGLMLDAEKLSLKISFASSLTLASVTDSILAIISSNDF